PSGPRTTSEAYVRTVHVGRGPILMVDAGDGRFDANPWIGHERILPCPTRPGVVPFSGADPGGGALQGFLQSSLRASDLRPPLSLERRTRTESAAGGPLRT